MSDEPQPQFVPLRNKYRMAMIALTLGSTLECGTQVAHETWAIGPTVNAAFQAWVKRNPKLVVKLKSRRVISSWETRQVFLDARTFVPKRAYHAKRP